VQNLPHPDSLDLTVVIPAYNESLRISRYLSSIISYLDRRGRSHEIIVVDDGSQDGTSAVVQALVTTSPRIRLVRLAHNRGKGYAVRTGMLQARGNLVLFADADGATAIQELERLEAALAAGVDLAIGSRTLAAHLKGYTVVARWHRTVLGNAFNRIVRHLGVHGFSDTQCGFKLFRREIAQDLFSVACVDSYGFDLEILYIAVRRGYRITEVPLNWSDQPGSKVSVLRDGLRMLYDLLAVRRRYAAGRYAVPAGDRPEALGYGREVSESPYNHSPIAHRP
jgi:dolichyl-phosphate beta-glucosyltransferase